MLKNAGYQNHDDAVIPRKPSSTARELHVVGVSIPNAWTNGR